ncbi:MAG: hypothetical protein D4S02_05025 [Rhodocyclaceae bacterium]|nr:MAG: hypothetical protein D4S02_05025 [Rhodocyclaceae bacterium]
MSRLFTLFLLQQYDVLVTALTPMTARPGLSARATIVLAMAAALGSVEMSLMRDGHQVVTPALQNVRFR